MSKDAYAEKRLARLYWIVTRVAFTPGELADFCNTSRCNALKYLRRLQKQGLVNEAGAGWWTATRKADELVTELYKAIERRKENERKEK